VHIPRGPPIGLFVPDYRHTRAASARPPPLHVPVRGLVAEHDDIGSPQLLHIVSTPWPSSLGGDPVAGHRVKLDVCRRYRSRPHHRLGGVP
jgi:hypothetical protein